MDALSKVLARPTDGVRMVPCVVVSVSPPTVKIDGSVVPALFVAGTSYSVDAVAVAFLSRAGTPLVVPTIGA